MESIRLFIALAIIVLIGWNVLYLLCFGRNRLSFWKSLFISYGLGIGLVSFEMFLFYFFKANFELAKILLPWLPLFLVNIVIYLKSHKRGNIDRPVKSNDNNRRHLGLKIFLTIGIVFEVSYALFRALVKPIESYDAVAIYAIKSKIFYLAKSIPSNFFDTLNLFPHPDYPLNIPLIETFIYLFLGNLNDQLVKIIFPLYFIGILGILYFAVRRFASRAYALVFTFLLATIPQFNAYAQNAYLDLPLGYYCFTSAIFLFAWFEKIENFQYLLISAIFAALAGWTKNEGLMYCVINLLLIGIFAASNIKKIKAKEALHIFSYIVVISLALFPWLYAKRLAGVGNTDVPLTNLKLLNLVKESYYKIGPIAYEFQKQFFGPKKWNILWIALFLAFIFNYKKVFVGVQKYITISMILTLLGYVFFYMIAPIDVSFFVSKTFSRFLLHFLPVVIYWLALILREDIRV